MTCLAKLSRLHVLKLGALVTLYRLKQ